MIPASPRSPKKANFFERKRPIEHKKIIPKPTSKSRPPVLEKISIIERKKLPKDINFLLKALKSHFVFYRFSDSELENIISQMFFCEAQPNDFIFMQNDDASCFFIIEKGSCQVIINEDPKKQLVPGDGFGDLALLYNSPRTGSIQAIDKVGLWGIDRVSFKKAVEEISVKDYEVNRAFIEDIKFFKSLTEQQKDGIAGVLILQKFNKDQNIVCEGDPGSSYYIIKEGSVRVLKGEKEVRRLGKGESFGEQALYYNCARTMTCRAAEDNTKCLALGRDLLVKILGDSIQVIILRNAQRWALEKSQVFSKLNKIIIEKILDCIQVFNYKAGDVILRKTTIGCQKVLIVMEGCLKANQKLIEKGNLIGDLFFLEENQKKPLDFDVICEKDSSIGEISLSDFQKCLGGKFKDVVLQNEKHSEKKNFLIDPAKKKATQKMDLKDFYLIKKLGAGQFGSVYLVKHKSNDTLYALKSMDKKQIMEMNLYAHAQQERQVCDLISFPLIMQFLRSYKTDHQVYFLLEFIKGQELFDVIREIGLLNIQQSQYFIASMILAIEYLNSLNIIYRDIKPENIMITHEGQLKLIDMGTAKILKGKANRTFTIIGTPHYMAPEIIGGKGYMFHVDLWSIGAVLYEFMCGMVPFGEDMDDPYEIYEFIIKKPISFPGYFKDKKSQKFIEHLMNKIPDLRLGGSFTALKANTWFDNFDWDALLCNELKPPFIPKSGKYIDEKEIEKQLSLKKSVLSEINNEKNTNKRVSQIKAGLNSPRRSNSNILLDWDKDF